jgi:hypothetical protein
MTLTSIAARNIGRNKLRTALTVSVVAIAILFFLLLRTVVWSWTSAAEFSKKDRIASLARAMMHSDALLALLAFDSLRALGNRIVHAREEIEVIAKESRDPAVLARAAILLAILNR